MPLTFIKYFYIGANLHWFFTSYEWPDVEVFKSMVNRFKEAFSTFSSGTRIGDFEPYGITSSQSSSMAYSEEKEEELPQAVYSKLVTLLSSSTVPFSSTHSSVHPHPILNNQVNYVSRIQHGGVTFATRRSAMRDSFIVFDESSLGHSSQTFPRAGQITDIFLHGRAENGNPIFEYFAIIEEYVPLEKRNAVKDPYRVFPDLQARLFYRRSRPSPQVIRLHAIRAHFAALFYKPDDIDEECVVVRSLDRVRLLSREISDVLTRSAGLITVQRLGISPHPPPILSTGSATTACPPLTRPQVDSHHYICLRPGHGVPYYISVQSSLCWRTTYKSKFTISSITIYRSSFRP